MLIVASFTQTQDFQFLKDVLQGEYGLIERVELDKAESQSNMNELSIRISKSKIELYYGLPRLQNCDSVKIQSKETVIDLIAGIFYLVDTPQKLFAYIPANHQPHIGTTVFMEQCAEGNIYCRKINIPYGDIERRIPISPSSSATSQFLNVLFTRSYAELLG